MQAHIDPTNEAACGKKKAESGTRLLRAVLGGLLAAALAVGGLCTILPGLGKADDRKLYDYLYSDTRSRYPSFVTQNMSPNSHLAFGSSEFSTPKSLVPTVPAAVFGEHNTGVDMTFVGTAFDQSLWQAIAAGAYDGTAPKKKITLILSPQWFFKGNGAQWAFKRIFSYELYRQFCDNPNISEETKAYVRKRLGELGIDKTSLAAANKDTFIDELNDRIFTFGNELNARRQIRWLNADAPYKTTERRESTTPVEPDWNALIEQGRTAGKAKCTNNEYGVYDSYFTQKAPLNSEKDETFSQADLEYEDLRSFMRVCRECGWEPLVVMLPVHGSWYDRQNVTAEERQGYYARVRAICNEAGYPYADFSSCEYEKYFLCDMTHPGWVGWVRIEKAIYSFINDRDDAFLGGGSFGEAEGLSEADLKAINGDD